MLESDGHAAFIVGGCVRDAIMKKEPSDWDICTSALPEQVIACFAQYPVIKTGLKHGTVTVVVDGENFEITTFRVDGDYTDHRRPDSVAFTAKIDDDLSRRDFTMNAIAYNPRTGIVDPFNGAADITKGIVRCVGDSDARFDEDALRIMRALRFSAVLRFSISQNTAESMRAKKHLLYNISAERINAEFSKLLLGTDTVKVLREFTPIITEFLPEIQPSVGFEQFNPYHIYDVWEHTLESIGFSAPDLILRLTMLFHDLGKPLCFVRDGKGIGHFVGHQDYSRDIAETALTRLRFDNETIRSVTELVKNHDTTIESSTRSVKRCLNRMGEEQFLRLLRVKESDIQAQNPELVQQRLQETANLRVICSRIIQEKQCFSLKDLAVSGRDLIGLGIPEGKEIGVFLKFALDAVMREEIGNTRGELLRYVCSLRAKDPMA